MGSRQGFISKTQGAKLSFMTLLSILIPTLPERVHLLQRCTEHIGTNPEVEIVIDNRPLGITTGQKRNDLIDRAQGEYVCFVDDDDFVQPGYLNEIIYAIKMNDYPDCVTFEGWMSTDGKFTADWVIKLGENYEDRGGIYYRFPNHLVPIKKRIAQRVKFPDKTLGEDFEWAKGIRDRGLIKTSFHIPKKLYHYCYLTRK